MTYRDNDELRITRWELHGGERVETYEPHSSFWVDDVTYHRPSNTVRPMIWLEDDSGCLARMRYDNPPDEKELDNYVRGFGPPALVLHGWPAGWVPLDAIVEVG